MVRAPLVLGLLLVPLVGCAAKGEVGMPLSQSYVVSEQIGPDHVGPLVARCVEDAVVRLRDATGQQVQPRDVRVVSWPEAWPNSALGMGGVALQAVTIAQTVVIAHPESSLIIEYRDGRFVEMKRGELPQVMWRNVEGR